MNIIDVFDRVAGDYDNVGVDFFTPMAAALIRAAAPLPGERVLDLGCGRGAALLPAARAVGPTGRVTGIDLAPGMVSRTAAATAGMPQVSVATGDAQRPDFPAGSFDLITAAMVLFFLPDPPAALAAYRRLLRPGGRLAFTSFAAHDPRYPLALRVLSRFAATPPPEFKPHAMFGSADALRSATTAAGFARTRVSEIDIRSHFRDAGQLVGWIGSHLGRQVLDRVPEQQRGDAVAQVEDALDWPSTFTTRIRVVLADQVS